MSQIVGGLFITLDGVIESPEKWNPPYYNDELNEAVVGQLAASDTHLYGRRSFELFRSVFTGPSAECIAHAAMMTDTAKVVVSKTLTRPDWGATKLISGDVAAELTALKREPGKDITVGASGTLVRFLLEQRLLDQLNLLVHPVVVGAGARLFEDGHGQIPLELVDCKPLTTGVVSLRYVPKTILHSQ